MEEELHDMRKKIHELRSAVKEKFVVNLDGMIKMIDSSFTMEVLNFPLPPNEVMCRAFPTILKGVTKVWFSKFPLGTIGNF